MRFARILPMAVLLTVISVGAASQADAQTDTTRARQDTARARQQQQMQQDTARARQQQPMQQQERAGQGATGTPATTRKSVRVQKESY